VRAKFLLDLESLRIVQHNLNVSFTSIIAGINCYADHFISTVLRKHCFILVKVYHRKMTYMMWLFSSKVIILICRFSAHLSWHPWYSVQQISQQLHWTVEHKSGLIIFTIQFTILFIIFFTLFANSTKKFNAY
jgi:hypothetical protein